MPRKPVRDPGKRSYGTKDNYSKEKLEECLEKIKSGALGQRKAAKLYNIPRSTLNLKLKNKHMKPVGHPINLSMEEEILFRDHLLVLSDLGIPIGLTDLKNIVKQYLDSIKKKVPVFKDNLPGYDWGRLFLARHPAVKEKIAHNIPRKRAQVSEQDINAYYDQLSRELDGIPPGNIYNMDETGFHDDPGKKKLLFRRSCRHPDVIRNATKSCFTVVFCANAAGGFVPPFFIFKGQKYWSDWMYKAPPQSRMSVSKSGWIDTEIFEEWLKNHLIPVLNKQQGKKVLICDNLSSHISLKSLQLCEQHNIKFICLIPNSTHLLQPLDVGYFAALKCQWRSVLNSWRQTARGKKAVSLPKNLFVQLVAETLNLGKDTAAQNVQAGFRKTGIYPLCREIVLRDLPAYVNNNIQEQIGESFKEYIETIRTSDLAKVIKAPKFQLPVIPGKSVSAEEVENFYKTRDEEDKKRKEKPVKRGRPIGSKGNIKKKKIQSIIAADEVPDQGLSTEPVFSIPSSDIQECSVQITDQPISQASKSSVNEKNNKGKGYGKKTKGNGDSTNIKTNITKELVPISFFNNNCEKIKFDETEKQKDNISDEKFNIDDQDILSMPVYILEDECVEVVISDEKNYEANKDKNMRQDRKIEKSKIKIISDKKLKNNKQPKQLEDCADLSHQNYYGQSDKILKLLNFDESESE